MYSLDTPQNVVRKGDAQRLEPALGVPAAAEARQEPELASQAEAMVETTQEPTWYEPPVAEAPRAPTPRPPVSRQNIAPSRSSDDTEVASSLH